MSVWDIRRNFQKKVDVINRMTREPMDEATVERLWTQALAEERNRIRDHLKSVETTMNSWANGRGVMAETNDGYVMLRKADVAHLVEAVRRAAEGVVDE